MKNIKDYTEIKKLSDQKNWDKQALDKVIYQHGWDILKRPNAQGEIVFLNDNQIDDFSKAIDQQMFEDQQAVKALKATPDQVAIVKEQIEKLGLNTSNKFYKFNWPDHQTWLYADLYSKSVNKDNPVGIVMFCIQNKKVVFHYWERSADATIWISKLKNAVYAATRKGGGHMNFVVPDTYAKQVKKKKDIAKLIGILKNDKSGRRSFQALSSIPLFLSAFGILAYLFGNQNQQEALYFAGAGIIFSLIAGLVLLIKYPKFKVDVNEFTLKSSSAYQGDDSYHQPSNAIYPSASIGD
jgi:hypothetical protein